MKVKAAIVSSLLVLAASAQPPAAAPTPGQPGGRGMMGGPRIVSPEIKDDKAVIFRLRAPEATVVLVNGDWPEGRGSKMTKDDTGIWSATVGPLTPELWAYTFNVNGVGLLDSANPNILRDNRAPRSLFGRALDCDCGALRFVPIPRWLRVVPALAAVSDARSEPRMMSRRAARDSLCWHPPRILGRTN